MKLFFLFVLSLIFGWQSSAQNFKLQIIGASESETRTIDSLQYNPKHENIKAIRDQIDRISAKLSQIGYIDNTVLTFNNTKDSTFMATIAVGKKITSILLSIGQDDALNRTLLLNTKNKTIEIPYLEIESFLKQTIQNLEQSGFALAKLKLKDIQRSGSSLYATLALETDQKRILNSIVIRYPDQTRSNKFPKGYLNQINKKYQNITFNKKIVEQIHTDFEKFSFVSQVKYPEILFTKDSTKVYVYLENSKSNTFDGYLGFSNDNNKKITFNGYLDITLQNILRVGEQLSVYWKSDGNDQKTFKANFELPYLLQTPVGLKAQLHVFRQDSTFQNTKTAIDLSYFINYNSRLYLGYHATESNDIQNLNGILISDFNNTFITTSYEYTIPETTHLAFPIKSKFQTAIGIGTRTINTSAEDSKNNQLILNIQAMHTIYLNKKNLIYVNSQSNYLSSNRYINNELFRFGGLNSIRGFAENSLQAYFTTTLLSEYRYILSPNLYFHSILDYGLYKNKSGIEKADRTENLLGIGIGMGLQAKNGLLKVALANGKTKKQQFEVYNTFIQISYTAKF